MLRRRPSADRPGLKQTVDRRSRCVCCPCLPALPVAMLLCWAWGTAVFAAIGFIWGSAMDRSYALVYGAALAVPVADHLVFLYLPWREWTCGAEAVVLVYSLVLAAPIFAVFVPIFAKLYFRVGPLANAVGVLVPLVILLIKRAWRRSLRLVACPRHESTA